MEEIIIIKTASHCSAFGPSQAHRNHRWVPLLFLGQKEGNRLREVKSPSQGHTDSAKMEIPTQSYKIPNPASKPLIVMACSWANLKDRKALPPNWPSSVIDLEGILHLNLPKAWKAILNNLYYESLKKHLRIPMDTFIHKSGLFFWIMISSIFSCLIIQTHCA